MAYTLFRRRPKCDLCGRTSGVLFEVTYSDYGTREIVCLQDRNCVKAYRSFTARLVSRPDRAAATLSTGSPV